jgi:anion-transporting  ArsA/GET3 family ATPase
MASGESFSADTLSRPMDGLLDKRLLFVTGKGGVGKSTVAAALGLVAARVGLRTIVAEIAGQDRLARALAGDGGGFEERELADDLYAISIDPQHALSEYLRLQMPARPMADLLTSSRMFQYFTAATPGMRELVTIGKVWELAQLERRTRGAAPYDLAIVDAPATGHGLGLLSTPSTFADVARVGPVARQARVIDKTLRDPRFTAVVIVTHPTEMPVTETLSLVELLDAELGVAPAAVIVNGVTPDRFSDRQATTIAKALADSPSDGARAALRAALSQHSRARIQAEQLERLRAGIDLDPVILPFVFSANGERAVFEQLADHLDDRVRVAA